MNDKTTIFISRSGADAAFASEIGRVLEDAGFTVTLQQWDFANRNFMERIHTSLAGGGRIIALLSPEYLHSDHCAAEWQNAIADDPLNKNGRLILLRVDECEPPGLLAGLAYWDLVPIRDDRRLWSEVVRDAVRTDHRGDGPVAGPYWRSPRTILDPEAIRRVPSFTGREHELAAIAAELKGGSGVAAVHGLGGAGKSSIAREYAWRNREQYAVIWWLSAQSEDGIIDGLLRLGSIFVRGLDQLRDRRVAAQRVTGSVLSGFAKPILLVFDNLEDERLLSTWRPRSGAKVLATSRNASWGGDIASFTLGPWSLEDASAYLRLESRRNELTEAVANELADALGALPLALAHAAAYLRATRVVTPQRYLNRIAEHLANPPRNAEYPCSVFATFRAAIATAEREAPGAAALLCLLAWFAPDNIPDELFRQADGLRAALELRPLLPDVGPGVGLHAALANEGSLDAGFGVLDRLSLVAFAEAERTYRVHRLVQLAARDLVGDATRAWVECAVTMVNSAFPSGDFETWQHCDQLLRHARTALSALPDDVVFLPAADLAHRCSVYLRERGSYAEAESLALRAVAIREKAFGPDHLDVAYSLNNLAAVRFYQGRYGEAEATHARALTIREKTLGPDHPDVAYSLNNLAVVYEGQGRYGEAEATHARALAIREKALAPEDPIVALSLNNLAVVYFYQGRYAEAAAMHARALGIWEKALGPEHPDFAQSLNNLADVYERQGRYGEAEAMHSRALAIREKVLGPAHAEVAASLNNLAGVYESQRRYHEAEPMHRRALEIWEKALGPEHPYVAESLNNLGTAYEHRGSYAEAEAMLARALAIREKALGPEHQLVGKTLRSLGSTCSAQGRYEEAAQFYARALELCEKTLGPQHPEAAAIREELKAIAQR